MTRSEAFDAYLVAVEKYRSGRDFLCRRRTDGGKNWREQLLPVHHERLEQLALIVQAALQNFLETP